MTLHFLILCLLGAGLALAFVEAWRRRREPPPMPPTVGPEKSLEKLRARGVARSLPAEFAQAVQERIEELIGLLTEAHSALIGGGPGALGLAAKKIVDGRRLTGHAWRKYLAASTSAAKVGAQIKEAFQKDAEPLVNEITRLLAAQPTPTLVQREEAYVLMCAACGESAVTFRSEKGSICANSISNVYATTWWSGETGLRLAQLLAEGDARAVLDYLASPDRLHCPAYCPECDRVYCREHYAVDDEWSGSWYTAGYATCPLGHEREFE